MAEDRVQRRLTTILAADVVDYSRLMEQDEAGTMSLLRARRHEVLMPAVARQGGRVFKVMGDGVLIEFTSVVNAVECAAEGDAGAKRRPACSPAHPVAHRAPRLPSSCRCRRDLRCRAPGSACRSGTLHRWT